MKKQMIILGLLFVVYLLSCEKDNYSPPSSFLTGAIIDDIGDTMRVSNGKLRFELWQDGFEKKVAIDGFIRSNGTFSSLLFDGLYKFVFPSGSYPFEPNEIRFEGEDNFSDSLELSIQGNTNYNVVVKPFFKIKEAVVESDGLLIRAKFKLEEGTGAREVEMISLYINSSIIVDNFNYFNKVDVDFDQIENYSNISIEQAISNIKEMDNVVYCRIGVKIKGIEDSLFSKVFKISI